MRVPRKLLSLNEERVSLFFAHEDDRNDLRLVYCRTASRSAYLAYVTRGLLRRSWTIPGIHLAHAGLYRLGDPARALEVVARLSAMGIMIAIDDFGNVYVTGTTNGHDPLGGDYDYGTVKYNSAGQQLWLNTYNGPMDGWDEARAIAIDKSGNVYVTGRSAGLGTGRFDYATVKYNSSGQEQWVARYNGPGNNWDGAEAIAVEGSGNVYVTGESVGSNIFDYATIKYDSSGQQQWVARYDGPGNSIDDIARAIALDASNNVYITGTSDGDYATIKYNGMGQEEWVVRYAGSKNGSLPGWRTPTFRTTPMPSPLIAQATST